MSWKLTTVSLQHPAHRALLLLPLPPPPPPYKVQICLHFWALKSCSNLPSAHAISSETPTKVPPHAPASWFLLRAKVVHRGFAGCSVKLQYELALKGSTCNSSWWLLGLGGGLGLESAVDISPRHHELLDIDTQG